MSINNLLINEKYLPDSDAERIVLHWTGGGAEANSDDRQHYHIIVNQDGRLVYGVNSIRDNDNTRDGRYAAHCYRNNTRCIGLSLAGMADSVERPFDPGSAPITHAQYEIGCRVAAELCMRYKIDIVPKNVLNHGEVQSILGIKQRQKWDVMVLPWNLSLSWEQVGTHFRQRVSYYWRELMGLNRPFGSDLMTAVEPYEARLKKALMEEGQELFNHYPAEETVGQGDTYTVNARSGLNIRVSAGLGSRKMGAALPYGTPVAALTSPDGNVWTKVVHPFQENKTGWVASRFLIKQHELPVG
jgi:hypothetical protein